MKQLRSMESIVDFSPSNLQDSLDPHYYRHNYQILAILYDQLDEDMMN